MNDYRQYPQVNCKLLSAATVPLAVQTPSPQPTKFNAQVSPQPILHPLQQATLVLQQRKMSEVCYFFRWAILNA